MNVYVNDNNHTLSQGTTLEALLVALGLNKKSVVVELNRKVVDRNALEVTELRENDTLEIVRVVGGG